MTEGEVSSSVMLGLWRSLCEAFIRSLFGEDIFISYSRKDTAYILQLANLLLERGISPYVDQWASPIGAELPQSLKRALSRAKMLVVVATSDSAVSENVELEIRHFMTTNRPVCIVNVAEALGTARWRRFIPGPEPIKEADTALKSTTPSSDVVARILGAARFTRSKTLLRVYSVCAVCIILIGVLGASYFGWRAKTAREDEASARGLADSEKARAATERGRAEAASKEANNAARLRKAAELARDEANKEADRINRDSTSRKLAATSRDVVGDDPLLGLRLGVQALRAAPTPEAASALRFALAAPKPWRILPGRYRDLDFGLNDFFTIDRDSTVSLWDLKSGRKKWNLAARDVLTAEWSNDGRQVVTTSRDGSVDIWNAQTRARTGGTRFEAGFVVHASLETGDRVLLTAHPDGKVRRISLESDQQVGVLPLKVPVERVWMKDNYLTAWTKDKEWGYQRAVWYFDPNERKLDLIDSSPIMYFDLPGRPSGRWMVLAGEIQDGTRLKESIGSNRLSGKHLAVTPNGALSITTWEGNSTIWATWNKRPLATLPRHESGVVSARFSPRGDQLATITEQGVVRMWKIPDRMMIMPPSRPTLKEVVSMSFSDDGSTLATADKWGDFILWDTASGEPRDLLEGPKSLQAERSRVAFDKTGKFLFASTELGKAEVWNWRSRTLVLSQQLPQGAIPRFSRDGRLLAAAPKEGGAIIIDLVNDIRKLYDPGTIYCDLAPTPDGSHVIASSHNGNVIVHNATTWKVVAHLENSKRGGCSKVEVDEDHGANALILTPQKASMWRWQATDKAEDIDKEWRQVIGGRFFSGAPFFAIGTLSDARLYDLRDLSLLQKMENVGRSNTAVALNGREKQVATCQRDFDYYLFLRSCTSCVDRGLLMNYSEQAISVLAEEEKHLESGSKR